jgi:hypothetical protein
VVGEGVVEDLFTPVNQYIENLYYELSFEGSKALEKYGEELSQAKNQLNRIMFWDATLTEENVKIIEKSFSEAFDVVIERTKAMKEEAILAMSDLVEKGLLTETQAQEALKAAEKKFAEEEDDIKEAQDKITKILTKAKDEQRDLTEQEQEEITQIIKDADEANIAVIKAGVGDRQAIMDMLQDREKQLTSVRLSEIIQFANKEYDVAVESANKTYEESIASADKLYRELGVIDEEQYKKAVENAKKTRKAEVDEAETKRKQLVDEARAAAGEIANTVDPETGEIYSKWELLWDKMYYKVVSLVQKIITKFNNMMDSIYAPINAMIDLYNKMPSWLSGGKKYEKLSFNLPVPQLAQGTVVPPNKEFAAILGDNKTEHEIVSPLSTMKQAFKEAMFEIGGNYGGGNTEVVLEIDGREFGRAVVEQGNRENRRIGTRLVVG